MRITTSSCKLENRANRARASSRVTEGDVYCNDIGIASARIVEIARTCESIYNTQNKT